MNIHILFSRGAALEMENTGVGTASGCRAFRSQYTIEAIYCLSRHGASLPSSSRDGLIEHSSSLSVQFHSPRVARN